MYASTNVNDNPQSPSYPALSYLSPSNLIMPGVAGNPFGVPVMWLGRPLGSSYPSPLAPREIETLRLSIGISGQFYNGFDWDLHYTSSEDDGYISQPDTSTNRFTYAIRGEGGVNKNQTWNLFDSSKNSQSLIDWISTKQETWTNNKLEVVDFVLSGEIISNSIGIIGLAAGLQLRQEEFSVSRDEDSRIEFDDQGNISKPADLLFLGGGIEAQAKRDAYAAFAELSISTSDNFDIKMAARYEELENDSTFDPKLSLLYKLTDYLSLRGSISSSFREPSLSQLYSGQVGLQGIQDYSNGIPKGGTSFIRIAQNGNNLLSPEESENINIGILWKPDENFDFKIDYWSIDYSNVITIESAQGKVINEPLNQDIKRTIDGTLIGVTTKYFNAANVDTNGIDIELNYENNTNFGLLNVGLRGTHILEYEIPGSNGLAIDVVGLFNHDNFARSLPETKIVLNTSLSDNNHKVSLFGRYVSDYSTTRPLSSAAKSSGFDQKIDQISNIALLKIQNRLFDLGSNIAYDHKNSLIKLQHLDENDVLDIEKEIDRMEKRLPILTNFILPSGNKTTSICHIARTVRRRAERNLVELMQHDSCDEINIKYLNRLSDYLFVLARYNLVINDISEILWEKKK